MLDAATEAGHWQAGWQQLVEGLERVGSAQGEARLLERLARPGRPTVLAFVNAHAMNSAAVSPAFLAALRDADVVLRDGSGMALLLKLVDLRPGLNLNGTDLIPKLLRAHAGRPIALFGTEEPYLERAREHVLAKLAPGSACVTADGFRPAAHYVRLATAQRPELIVLGMGMPRQEEVASMLRATLRYPCLIVCGGAIIDFMGGKTSRAPRWLRALGLEWTYRLALEPRRLFRRYVIGNPLFVARALAFAACVPRPGRDPA